jgi:hypothetical protein
VVQVPVIMVVASGATAYLAQLRIKLIIDNWGTTLIFKGTNYISLHIFISLIQIIFNYNKISMSRIRGKKSGILPQRHNRELSNLDFVFLWAWCGIVIVSPIFGMGFNILLGAFPCLRGEKILW